MERYDLYNFDGTFTGMNLQVGAEVSQTIAIDIDDMSIDELCKFIVNNPSILRRPIIIDNKTLQIGYDEEEIEIFFDNSAKFLQTRRQINCKKTFETVQLDFNFADFKVWFSARLKNADILHDAALQRALLPFAAWCQHKNLYKSGQDSFLVVLELAKKQLLK